MRRLIWRGDMPTLARVMFWLVIPVGILAGNGVGAPAVETDPVLAGFSQACSQTLGTKARAVLTPNKLEIFCFPEAMVAPAKK